MKLATTHRNNSVAHDSLMYLWRQRSMFIGPAHHARTRRYFADCLIFGFDGPLRIKVKGEAQYFGCRIAALRAGTEFFMEADGDGIGVLFLDNLGLDFQHCKTLSKFQTGLACYDFDPDLEGRLLACVARINRNASRIEEVESSLFDALGLDRTFDHYTTPGYPGKCDPRLSTIIHMYLNGELGLNSPVVEAASSVGLSTSRVVQLFREHLGITFRTFRNRQRIHMFMLAFAFGKTQSQAALEAGFVDQAHFCRRFKESVGIKASVYLSTAVRRIYFVEREMARRYLNNEPVYGSVSAR